MFAVFFLTRENIAFFPFRRNYTGGKSLFQINSRGLQMLSSHILSIRILTLPWPWFLFGLTLAIIFSKLSAMKLIVRNILSVTYLRLEGSLLQFFNKERWLEKKELKSSAFSLKPVIKRFSWNNGAISRIFFIV